MPTATLCPPALDEDGAVAAAGLARILASCSSPRRECGEGEDGVNGMMRRRSLVGENVKPAEGEKDDAELAAPPWFEPPDKGENRSSSGVAAVLLPPAAVRLVVVDLESR